jgi:urease accessory protein
MIVVDTYVGNAGEDASVEMRLAESGARTVTVDEAQRQRSRFKTVADDGTEVGVVVPFGGNLRSGDVFEGEDGLVRVELAPRDALVIDLEPVATTHESMLAAVRMAHALGNRHRDLAVRGCVALVPVEDDADAERVREVVAEYLPAAELRRDEVDPGTFDGSVADHSHGGEG